MDALTGSVTTTTNDPNLSSALTPGDYESTLQSSPPLIAPSNAHTMQPPTTHILTPNPHHNINKRNNHHEHEHDADIKIGRR